MNLLSSIFLVAPVVLVGALTTYAEGKADLVLTGGTIVTMEKSQPEAGALAVVGDRIAWIGDSKDAARWIGEGTTVIDLHGAFVFPGLIESHAHIVSLGGSRLKLDLVGTSDKRAVLEKVRAQAARTSKGEWILGRGWDQNDWPDKKFPSASDLDQVAPDNPVSLTRIDGHMLWVNSAAMKIAGIRPGIADPEGGKILRDDKGNPTGILLDLAGEIVDKKTGVLTAEQIARRTQIALEESARKGLTMVTDAGTEPETLAVWKDLAANDRLPVRIYSMIYVENPEQIDRLDDGPRSYGPWLDVRTVKLLIDGALGSRGAALLAPYSDDPKNTGLLLWKQSALRDVLRVAKQKGFQVGIHAIGDRANRIVLDEYEKLRVKDLRWRIEHAQVLSQQDIPRLSQLGVIASMQPTHATSDGPWATDRLGTERAKGAYAWRSLLKHHTLLAGGSDAPVEDINPLWGIYAAVTRRDHQGRLDWPDDSQTVSREEALRMFTIDAAYAAFHEDQTGSLKAGKLADMIVVPENLLTCEPKDLIDMKVFTTIVGGKVRYSAR
jgi:predicted amidohydrolase YtcJ